MAIGDSVTKDNWAFWQHPEMLYVLDPDQVIRFYHLIADEARKGNSSKIKKLLDLLDPDKCPDEFLPHLASNLGLTLYHQDSFLQQRNQIKSAVRWYKDKGLINSFSLLLNTLGFDGTVLPLWFDKAGHYSRDPLLEDDPDVWVPASRFDIELFSRDGSYIDATKVNELLNRLEEVRPVHALLRSFFTGIAFTEQFMSEDLSDATAAILRLEHQQQDVFRMIGKDLGAVVIPVLPDEQVITHSNGYRPRVQRDGNILYANNNGGPYLDYFTGEILLRNEIHEQVGTPVLRNGATLARHDGVVITQRNGSSDVHGEAYVYDFRAYAGEVYYDNLSYEWQVGNNVIASEDAFEEFVRNIFYTPPPDIYNVNTFYDGFSIRDSGIDRSGISAVPLDKLDLVTEFYPEAPTEPGSISLTNAEPFPTYDIEEGIDLTFDGFLDNAIRNNMYDGRILSRGEARINVHNFGIGVVRNGSNLYDGAIEHDAHGHNLRDGLINYSGEALNGAHIRNTVNPLGEPGGEGLAIGITGSVGYSDDYLDVSRQEFFYNGLLQTRGDVISGVTREGEVTGVFDILDKLFTEIPPIPVDPGTINVSTIENFNFEDMSDLTGGGANLTYLDDATHGMYDGRTGSRGNAKIHMHDFSDGIRRDGEIVYVGSIIPRTVEDITVHSSTVTRDGKITYGGDFYAWTASHDATGHTHRDGSITYSGDAYLGSLLRNTVNVLGDQGGENLQISVSGQSSFSDNYEDANRTEFFYNGLLRTRADAANAIDRSGEIAGIFDILDVIASSGGDEVVIEPGILTSDYFDAFSEPSEDRSGLLNLAHADEVGQEVGNWLLQADNYIRRDGAINYDGAHYKSDRSFVVDPVLPKRDGLILYDGSYHRVDLQFPQTRNGSIFYDGAFSRDKSGEVPVVYAPEMLPRIFKDSAWFEVYRNGGLLTRSGAVQQRGNGIGHDGQLSRDGMANHWADKTEYTYGFRINNTYNGSITRRGQTTLMAQDELVWGALQRFQDQWMMDLASSVGFNQYGGWNLPPYWEKGLNEAFMQWDSPNAFWDSGLFWDTPSSQAVDALQVTKFNEVTQTVEFEMAA